MKSSPRNLSICMQLQSNRHLLFIAWVKHFFLGAAYLNSYLSQTKQTFCSSCSCILYTQMCPTVSQIFPSFLFIGIIFLIEELQQHFVCAGSNDIYQSYHEHPVICKQCSLCLFFTKKISKCPDKKWLENSLVNMKLSSL